MKPALFLATPPLAFIAAVIFAGLVPPDDAPHGSNHPIPSGPRKRAAAMEQSTPTDIPSVLAEMERRIVHFPPPEVETYEAAGMERDILTKKKYVGFPINWAVSYEFEWAQKAPREMFEWLVHQSLVSGRERNELTFALFSNWAKADMAAALAAIQRMTHAESRAQALVSTLEVLCQKDPAQARDLLLRNIDSLESLKSVQLGFGATKERTELILALPHGRARSLLVAEHINHLANGNKPGDTEIAAELWKKSSPDERKDLVAAGLRGDAWDKIQLDGLEDLAKQNAETSNDPRQATYFINRYGKSWAERDPAEALNWTITHLKGKERTDQSLRLITHVASKGFDAAMHAWQTLPEGSLREEAAEILAETVPADRVAEKDLLEQTASKARGTGAW